MRKKKKSLEKQLSNSMISVNKIASFHQAVKSRFCRVTCGPFYESIAVLQADWKPCRNSFNKYTMTSECY